MSLIVVDIEADGPIPGEYSMVSFGAVVVESTLQHTFMATLHPISDKFDANALSVSGHSREDCMKFDDPADVMSKFSEWVIASSQGRPIFISDNNGFDWMFICWYFHKFTGNNPFGWSSRRIGDLYCGMCRDARASWKYLRKTRHTHNPLDDAMGNAEALLTMSTKIRGLV